MNRIPGRIVVELDDLASEMLRDACRKGTEHLRPNEDPRDLVSAAVTFFLCDDDDDRWGPFSLEETQGALNRAKHDRLVGEGKGAA